MTRLSSLLVMEEPPEVDDGRLCPLCGLPLDWRRRCPDWMAHEIEYGLEY